jgi:hypothetical protein
MPPMAHINGLKCAILVWHKLSTLFIFLLIFDNMPPFYCSCYEYVDGRMSPMAQNNEQKFAILIWYWFLIA